MSDNPVGWFEIYVDDLSRAKNFYEAVFDVSLENLIVPADETIQMLAFPSNMEKYGASGALVKLDGFTAGANSTLIYFSCDDCALEESKVNAAGGSVETSKMSIGEYGFISLAKDSEGNMFGLHSLK
ncbi:VOC family protein [Thalassotalea profundi]|uniref:Glyoxalase n=1 Tax=Thalassotalea profundi TaxID=2036687 RepID=A0ABQ3IY56_9GAMM|nr:VOC family protein [Thalassotalea profundi]GHE98047.1 glyoxalase [Thalassotalea profundi]